MADIENTSLVDELNVYKHCGMIEVITKDRFYKNIFFINILFWLPALTPNNFKTLSPNTTSFYYLLYDIVLEKF